MENELEIKETETPAQKIERENKLIGNPQYRNPLHMAVLTRLGILDLPNDGSQENMAFKYSPIIHRIIDNPEHQEIRKLILRVIYEYASKRRLLEEDFLEIAELIVKQIKQDESSAEKLAA